MNKSLFTFLSAFLLVFIYQSVDACSMYKVSIGDKTMVGCNQDAWRNTSKIWFENARSSTEYGVCFTGSRQVGPNRFAPQSAMNEAGLVFSRLVAYYPERKQNLTDKKPITNEVEFLTDILHRCKSVSDVREYVDKYDRRIFLEEVFIYIDKTGDYLVVEPYETIFGNDASYVLSNFCPSITSKEDARKQLRFKKGEEYLKINGIDTSLSFCRAMSDSMHVCRDRNGDGTLLTSIWDTQNGLVNLYFYHSYDTTIQFNIKDELAEGDHQFSIPELFPHNADFQQYLDYKTPFTVNVLRIALVIIAGIIFILSILFLFSYFRKRNIDQFNALKLTFAALNAFLIYYLFILASNEGIYYLEAPYIHPSSNLISLSSYIPFLLLLLFIPITFYTVRDIKVNKRGLMVKSSLLWNNVIYLILIVGFGYWGLFDVFR